MAEFYIRSWDPDSTYPSDPHEGDVCYTITLDQSWAPVAGVKNRNLVKEEVYTNGAWLEQGGGGGGGGDFAVASVHLVAYNGVNPVGIYVNQDDNSNLFGIFDNGVGFSGSLQTDGGEGAPTELTADLLMYGDSVGCSLYGNFISATGGASYSEEDYTLTITGDCTVTLEFND